MILGDSLLVMTSLAEKEGLKGKVQTIYFDPPYGIEFGSNWQVSTRKRNVADGRAEDTTRQPEQIRAFRVTWKLGIHSYLAYLRDRLVIARDLLTETSSVFVQIGDENVHLVRCLMDEVFGSENHIAQIATAKTSGQSDTTLALVADFVLWYGKDASVTKTRKLFQSKDLGGECAGKYTLVELADGTRTTVAKAIDTSGNLSPASRPYRLGDLTSTRPAQRGDVQAYEFAGRTFTPGSRTFTTDKTGLERLAFARRIEPSSNTLSYVRYLDDFPAFQLTNIWTDIGGIQSRADPKFTSFRPLSESLNGAFS
jgi:adenine-specific DNA-methyltransferase